MSDVTNRPLTRLLAEQTGRRWCQTGNHYASTEGGAMREMRTRHGASRRWECCSCQTARTAHRARLLTAAAA